MYITRTAFTTGRLIIINPFLSRSRHFSLLQNVEEGSGARPTCYSLGTGRSFPVGKRSGRGIGHLNPSSAEDKSYVSANPPVLKACRGEILLYVLLIGTWYRNINMIIRDRR